MSKRINLILSDEAIKVLRQQDNMSKFVDRLILGKVSGNNINLDDLIEKLKEIIQKDNENIGKNKENNLNVKDSIMNLLDI